MINGCIGKSTLLPNPNIKNVKKNDYQKYTIW